MSSREYIVGLVEILVLKEATTSVAQRKKEEKKVLEDQHKAQKNFCIRRRNIVQVQEQEHQKKEGAAE